MTIKKIVECPNNKIRFKKHIVKQLPIDAKYKQQTVEDNEVYYSELKNAYYVVIE